MTSFVISNSLRYSARLIYLMKELALLELAKADTALAEIRNIFRRNGLVRGKRDKVAVRRFVGAVKTRAEDLRLLYREVV